MRNSKFIAGTLVLTALVASCKNEAEQTAEKNVDRYVVYVDSVNKIDSAGRLANWEAIEAGYEARLAEADAALAQLKDKAEAQKRVDESRQKYEGVKIQAENDAKVKAAADMPATGTGNSMADTLFGTGKVTGDDMSFGWVNKDNILGVYETFYENFKKNKDSYSRQELDRVKAWYEALDARKNTVEKEGLSAEDNNKIAAIKVKFSPLFRWERLTAKGKENEAAKKAAE
ncbi:hypothetical protein CHU92_10090 [Flavobacterium cyanobacteriorum]|uniref:Lipoprotein n=1 Tax=Flavobacterium cyanobacteriorum TaxID=2022802 RepID=A0A255Z3V4_9FLAO|nr:hypothetical protein [Flavobacterium cyanobacteriorum]OYQ36129.1 hypothetical protein CHU92_10090 [Flavobacterium cyanobacteriorum]